MLAYAFRSLKKDEEKWVSSEDFDCQNIYDLFAAILGNGIAWQLKHGLYREYVPEQEDLSFLRGKMDINETLHLQMQRKQKLSCRFDEFAEDNIYNQILKTTMDRLIREGDVKKERKQKLKKIIIFFSNVKKIPSDHIAWNRLIYQRNNRNYELLLNLCYFVLNGKLQTTDDGKYKLISFTDDQMNMVFQHFVFEYFRQDHKELDVTAPKMKWEDDKNGEDTIIRFLPEMQTDIMLTKNDQKLIIDTKYYGKIMKENYGKYTIPSSHLYQIFAYVKNMDKENTGNVSGLLLYAKTEEMFPEGKPFVIGKNSIGARTLDLNQEFSEISKQLDDIANTYFS